MTKNIVITDKEYALENLDMAIDSARCILTSDTISKYNLKHCLKQMKEIKMLLRSVIE